MKRSIAALSVLLMLAAVALHASLQSDNDTVEAVQLDAANWAEFASGGKEADAIYGDFVLRNKHVVAVIAQPLQGRHANLTVRDVGGCLIDLSVRSLPSDQLSAFYPGAKFIAFRSATIVKDDKTPGSVAVQVTAAATEDRPAIRVTYHLAPGSPFLVITSKFTNESAAPQVVTLIDSLRADAQKDDIAKTPDGMSEMFWFHDQYWNQAYGVEAPLYGIVTNTSLKKDSKLSYEDIGGQSKVTLAPGKSFEFSRRIIPGPDLPHVRAVVAQNSKQAVSPVVFTIKDAAGSPIANARLTLKLGDEIWGTLNTGTDGIARTTLPVGSYQLSAAALGIAIPSPVGGLPIQIKEANNALEFQFGAWRPGVVQARITDGDGKPLPCKIEFLAKAGTPQPDFGPETADFAVKSLCYSPDGKLTQQLPPGHYDVIVSHGPEHDAIFQELNVEPGKTVALTGKLPRVVNTTGWISSDFHTHSSPSGDNTCSQLGRVLGLACEHIEYAPCTEHNRIDTFQPHIDRMKLGAFIGTCTGMELTGLPLPLNHQNAFPLVMKPHLQDGGGPVTDSDIETQIERLALWDNRSEKLIQVNHADFGWLLRDKNGDRTPDEGHARIEPFVDVYEVHPVPDILTLDPYLTASTYKGNNRVFNWLQFLNQGRRMVGVVNTDSHYNFHEVGWLRNWVKSPTDDPAKVQALDIVRASSAGALVMSNGPFLDVKIAEAGKSNSVIAGQDLVAPSKKIVIDASVQCPNWLEIDRVFVLINGRISEQHHYRRDSHPDKFRSGVVRFAEKLEITLDRDAHIIVACGGEKSKLGKVHGPIWGEHHPAAFINPVFVDVDGNGFKPNGDTLGAPLPVKYQAPKK